MQMPPIKLSRRQLLCLGALQLSGLADVAVAQTDWPRHPIRLVIPLAPGGAADVAARHLGAQMHKLLGQPVIVESKPGADGVLAMADVARSKPDGYTIGLATATGLSYAPNIRKSLPYDVLKDFTPLSSFVTFTFFLMVHKSVPGKDLAEVVAHLKANPGKYAYGASSSMAILATEQLMADAGLDLVRAQYKGEGPMVADLFSGRVQVAWATPAVLPALLKDGNTRAVAVLLPERSPLLPDVPTLAESGQALVNVSPWGGMVAPANTPKPVVDALSKALRESMTSPDLLSQAGSNGLIVRASTPQEFGDFLRQQKSAWGAAIKLAKLPIQE